MIDFEPHQDTPHVLIIGIDGVRYDALRRLRTPHLDRIAGAGFLVPVPVDPSAPTISGPSWASILTGTLAADHGILNNDLSTGRLDDHPDLITLVRRARPEVATFAAAGWAPLVSADSGGPMLAAGGYLPPAPAEESVDGLDRRDADVTQHSAGFLRDHDGRAGSLAFCYLGAVDEVGHGIGTGPEYDAMIESSDTRVGLLLDAVADRPAAESWTVIAATDHGHRDGGGHGGDDVHERTAWIAACGPGIDGRQPVGTVRQVDVTGEVLHRFGIEADDPALIGRRFAAATAPV